MTITEGIRFIAFDGKTYQASEVRKTDCGFVVVSRMVRKDGSLGVQDRFFSDKQVTTIVSDATKKTSPRFIVKHNPDTTWEPYEVVDTLTGVVHEGSSLKAHSQRIADRMNLEAKPPVVLTPRTREDFLKLSYYTLCKLQSTTHFANPIDGLPIAIGRGEFKGILTVDDLGNFISFV